MLTHICSCLYRHIIMTQTRLFGRVRYFICEKKNMNAERKHS